MMQQPSMEMALRELTHPNHNEQLKNQQQVTFKLVKTGKSFLLKMLTYSYFIILIKSYKTKSHSSSLVKSLQVREVTRPVFVLIIISLKGLINEVST